MSDQRGFLSVYSTGKNFKCSCKEKIVSLGSIGLAIQLQMVHEAESFISPVLQRDLMSLFSLFGITWKSFL